MGWAEGEGGGSGRYGRLRAEGLGRDKEGLPLYFKSVRGVNVWKTTGGGPAGRLTGAEGRERRYRSARKARRRVRFNGVARGVTMV